MSHPPSALIRWWSQLGGAKAEFVAVGGEDFVGLDVAGIGAVPAAQVDQKHRRVGEERDGRRVAEDRLPLGLGNGFCEKSGIDDIRMPAATVIDGDERSDVEDPVERASRRIVGMHDEVAVVPELHDRNCLGQHELAHLARAGPASVVGIEKRDAWRRRGEHIARGGADEREKLGGLRRSDGRGERNGFGFRFGRRHQE